MYVYGRQPVLEALHSKYRVKSVFLAKESTGRAIGLIERACRNKQIRLIKKTKNDLQKYVGPVVHQGAVAEIEFQPFLTDESFHKLVEEIENPFLLVLDHIQDTHNMGAILRTAEIVGVHCVIVPEKGSAPLNATVAKTSAGALFYNTFFQTENLEEILQRLTESNISIFAAQPHDGTIIYHANFKQGTAIVIGSEDKGVRKNLLKYCNNSIKIPQFGKVNSLNASVSTAVILYEVVRQRNFAN
ncbi:23S rRNA (guanosine(2251)-2'-O)-methyltransferase RlmB [Calditrichota bacterium LG25]